MYNFSSPLCIIQRWRLRSQSILFLLQTGLCLLLHAHGRAMLFHLTCKQSYPIMQVQGSQLKGLPALQGGEASKVIPYYRQQGGKKGHSLALYTHSLQGGSIWRPSRDHHRATYFNLGIILINISNPCIQIYIKGKLFMFIFIYYMYDKYLKDKLSQINIMCSIPTTINLSSFIQVTNISLPPY